jgi:hypothetical protein
MGIMSNLLAFLLLLAAPANAGTALRYEYKECRSDTNYTRGSAFQANLDALLASLPADAAASSGFARNVTGVAPDQVFGLVQCRADINASSCRQCLDESVRDLGSECAAGQKTAILVYERCLVRHSNESFFDEYDWGVLRWRPHLYRRTRRIHSIAVHVQA